MGARMQIATAREVAAVLRLKEETVCRLASQGKLPGLKLGKSWRFDMGKAERLFSGIPRGGKERPEGDQQNIGEEGRRYE
jgi:excisionase family DNA binding protein